VQNQGSFGRRGSGFNISLPELGIFSLLAVAGVQALANYEEGMIFAPKTEEPKALMSGDGLLMSTDLYDELQPQKYNEEDGEYYM